MPETSDPRHPSLEKSDWQSPTLFSPTLSRVYAFQSKALPQSRVHRKAAIILWNTVYLERAIGALRQQGRQIDEGLLKHVAPVHWNHINLTGDYSWRQNKPVEKGGFRPLRIRP
jgi:hypothetical protein